MRIKRTYIQAGKGRPFLPFLLLCGLTMITSCQTRRVAERRHTLAESMGYSLDEIPSCWEESQTDVLPPLDLAGVEETSTSAAERSTSNVAGDLDPATVARIMQSYNSWLGCPYRAGGHSRAGFDCSGFTMTFFHDVLGIPLIHSSRSQFEYNCSQPLDKGELRCGDLVFFTTNGKRPSRANINHVGIYLEEGKFIHSSSRGGVRIDRLDAPYYIKTWVTGGRVSSLQ